MRDDEQSIDSDRRGLVKKILAGTVAGAALAPGSPAATPDVAAAAQAAGSPPARERVDAVSVAREARGEFAPPPEMPPLTADRAGADFMTDAIKKLDLPYLAANPASSLRGLQESLINYGGNRNPTWLTCTHEAVSVGVALGYARASGRPMAAAMKSAVGVQNAAIAIYNAFADRVPMVLLSSTHFDGATRGAHVDWQHSAQDNNAIVRDFTKWDDSPGSLQHFSESLMRGYQVALTPPMGPILLSLDSDLQEAPIRNASELSIPNVTQVRYPVAPTDAIREVAAALVAAEFPVIAPDRYARTDSALPQLVELAELLGAAVIDLGGRFNFPTHHPLNQTYSRVAAITQADYVLSLEPIDIWGLLYEQNDQLVKSTRALVRPDARLVSIGVDWPMRPNYQEFMRYVGDAVRIDADAEATLPLLIEEVRRRIKPADRRRFDARRAKLLQAFSARLAQDRELAAVGWDSSPITTARLCMELWGVLKDVDWTFSSMNYGVLKWPQRLWPFSKPHQSSASPGAGGLGDGVARAIGCALHHGRFGRIVVNIQPDGDFLYTPAALWTAAHHRIPMLTVVHNNRSYHQEIMHLQRVACRLNRSPEHASIGCAISDPDIDYAKLAQSMGVWAEGPISDPAQLAASLRRALGVVQAGQPALIDVLTEPR
jgi:acetolactate synthase I/II/III large subunit